MKLPVTLLALLALVALPVRAQQTPPPAAPPAVKPAATPRPKPPVIYDIHAEGDVLLKAALAKAKAENKNVFVEIGGNWCPWCQKLYTLIHTDPAISKFMEDNYVVVMVSVNDKDEDGKVLKQNDAFAAKYGAVPMGYPALVVFSANTIRGNPLVMQNSGTLEEGDHHSPAKVLAFLKTWVRDPASRY